MKKLLVLTAFVVAMCVTAFAAENDVAGDFEGYIDIPNMKLSIEVFFDGNGGGNIDIPQQNATDLELFDIKPEKDSLSFKVRGIPGEPEFRGEFSDNGKIIAGDFIQSGQKIKFSLTRKIADSKEENKAFEEDLKTFVDSVMKTHNVAGLSIAIVKNGKVILTRGYGYRDLKEKKPVTENTLFAIGSSTKAFTAASLSMLYDQGLVEWDKPVKTYLPDFELYDKNSTEMVTPLDLLTHRTGLPRHDFMWYGSNFTRKDLYDRLKYLEPNEGLRTKFQYQNHMFLTAGYLIEKISGKTWENFVAENIFAKLGMNNSNFSTLDSKKSADYSLPYKYENKKLVEVPFREFPAMGPAGTINSSSADMAKWILLWTNGGKSGNTEILKQSSYDKMTTPQMIVSQSSSFEERSYVSYGMGWFIEYYRGHYLVHHGGNIDGFSALVAFYPKDSLGVVVLTNGNATPVPSIISYYIADRMFNMEPVSWSKRIADQTAEIEDAGKNKSEEERVKNTKPSHKLSDYSGAYENPGYGIATVILKDGKLKIKYNDISLPLTHFHYDVFSSEIEGFENSDFKVKFEISTDGRISKLFIPLEQQVKDIEFTRVAESELTSKEYLMKFAGDYFVDKERISVEYNGADFLTLSTAGQNPYKIVPKDKNYFVFKDLSGFAVKFKEKNGNVIEMSVIQPNGTFVFKKEDKK